MFWRTRHPVADEQLSALADGQLRGPERTRIEAHVATCAPCRVTLAELRALKEALVSLPRARAPRSFALREADVRPAARPAPSLGGLAGAMPLLGGVATVAFLAFFVLVGIDVSGGGSSDTTSQGALLRYAPEAVGEDGAAEDAGSPPEPVSGLPDVASPSASPSSIAGDMANPGDEYVVMTATAFAAANAAKLRTPPGTPEPVEAAGLTEEGGGSSTGLRVAEMGTAALALVAGTSLALVWWRRRT